MLRFLSRFLDDFLLVDVLHPLAVFHLDLLSEDVPVLYPGSRRKFQPWVRVLAPLGRVSPLILLVLGIFGILVPRLGIQLRGGAMVLSVASVGCSRSLCVGVVLVL